MVNHIVSALPLMKHSSLEQTVKNLLKELPEDHNDDVEVVIYLDGMWGFGLDKPVVVDGKAYPVRFSHTNENQNKPTGWVGLNYSQGIFESASKPQGQDNVLDKTDDKWELFQGG